MKAKWKISPIPQSPNPNQRPQLRSGLFSSSRAYRWPRSALRTPRTLRLWPPGHACDGACECVRRGHGAPRERLYGSQAASSSLKSSSSTHATSLYGARCYGGVAHGRARRLHHDAFGKEDRPVGQNERALSLPESHSRRISAPSGNSWQ